MANTTTDHETIRKWTQDRGGVPATVEGTEDDGEQVGILRLDFPNAKTDASNLSTISWEQFFEKFDEQNLAIILGENDGDTVSRFNKFVSRG